LIKRRFRLAFSLLSAVPTVRLSIAFDARSARAARCRSEGADFVFTERPSSTSSVHTFVFRSYNLILQSDEPDLMRDVCFDIDKAQTKLARSGDSCSTIANTLLGGRNCLPQQKKS
jgi:hypothetical protein